MAPAMTMTMPMPTRLDEPFTDDLFEPATPWVVVVWDDPINTMEYVVFVFQKLFGFNRDKATKLMLEVHNNGKSAVTSGTKDEAERDVFRLHEYGLWATLEQG